MRIHKLAGFIILTPILIFSALKLAKAQTKPLETVPHVDLQKYAGKWYEIAAFPQRFQKGCTCTTAQYTPTEKGYVTVENNCIKADKNGKKSGIKGKAFVVENSGNAKLDVQFFWPFKGKYWIIELPEDYSYAVVGNPDREYLWILSRTPEIDQKLYEDILKRTQEKGFDMSKLQKTIQTCNQ